MTNRVYAVTEVVGTSTQGLDDAIRSGIRAAAKSVRNLNWFEVVEIRGHIDAGEAAHFQVQMKLGFRHEG